MKTVETFYGGVKNSKGELIFSGQALGNPIGAQQPTNQAPGGVFDLVRIAYNDPERRLAEVRSRSRHEVPRREDRLRGCRESRLEQVQVERRQAADHPRLVATPASRRRTTIWYYESVLNKMGKNQSDWMRLFMAPGMGHCGGGPGVNTFDSIGTLEKWVEKGVAPDTMLGTGAQGMTRPLCPYPQAAEYKGSGDLKDASNWSCKAPR